MNLTLLGLIKRIIYPGKFYFFTMNNHYKDHEIFSLVLCRYKVDLKYSNLLVERIWTSKIYHVVAKNKWQRPASLVVSVIHIESF